MITLKQYFFSSLIYLLIIAVLGFLLRNFTADLISMDFIREYEYGVHTHSHIALLGWVYIALTTLLGGIFLPHSLLRSHYLKWFIATQLTIIGMLITFPLQGYAFSSILFSSLFLITTYIFWWLIINCTCPEKKQLFAFSLAKYALFYLAISSIGPWSLGGIIAVLGKTSVWYKLAIYFYLHFQYNGWFILAITALVFYIVEKKGIPIKNTYKKPFLITIHLGIILSFFLSTLWAKDSDLNYFISNVGNFFQILGFVLFLLMIRKSCTFIFSRSTPVQKTLVTMIGIIFFSKLIMQVANGLPFFHGIIASNKDLVIGYLHWYFLGFITPFILLLAEYFKLIKINIAFWVIYFLAFFTSEFFIAYRAASVMLDDHYLIYLNNYIAISSGIYMISIFWLLFINIKTIRTKNALR